MNDFDDLKFYMDNAGRVTQWPSARRGKGLQEIVIEYMAQKFEIGRRYTEREVNDILNASHTFGDAALLRREMYERGYIQRLKDGSAYWREAEDNGLGKRGFG